MAGMSDTTGPIPAGNPGVDPGTDQVQRASVECRMLNPSLHGSGDPVLSKQFRRVPGTQTMRDKVAATGQMILAVRGDERTRDQVSTSRVLLPFPVFLILCHPFFLQTL